MALTWKRSFETGIDWQDNQHKELFARINNLLHAMEEGRGKDELVNLLRFLDSYVVVHFGSEEKEMAKFRFRDKDTHRAEHDLFKKKLQAIKKEIERGVNLAAVIKTQQETVDWLIHHIGRSDKKFGDFLKALAV